MLDKPESPKLSPATRRSSIYPYYAGFSEQFVHSILKKIEATNSDLILDPWNGSGTTTSVCSQVGIRSIGVDLNPAMKPIAAVRTMPPTALNAVSRGAMKTVDTLPQSDELVSPFSYCGSFLEAAKLNLRPSLHDGLRFGLMITCRTLARQVRSKNPTWYSLNSLRAIRLNSTLIRDEIISSFAALQSWRNDSPFNDSTHSPTLKTADWESYRRNRAISHVITSPPYLTRIDYVMKTLPELMLLNEEEEIDLATLRKKMLGGVITSAPQSNKPDTVRSSSAKELLERIQAHDSKASPTYYYRFFKQYFIGLQSSIANIANVSNRLKTITFVTQGSYYKEIFIDLPSIIDELLEEKGFLRSSASSFLGSNNMVTVNTRSVASGLASPPEMAVTYERK